MHYGCKKNTDNILKRILNNESSYENGCQLKQTAFSDPIHVSCNNELDTNNICKVLIPSLLDSATSNAEFDDDICSNVYVCKFCSKIFTNKLNLKNHLSDNHASLLFKCNVTSCSFFCTNNRSLYRHKASQHPIKKIKCTELNCSTIMEPQRLDKHLRIRHGIPQTTFKKNSWICFNHLCQKKFSSVKERNDHMKISHSSCDNLLSCCSETPCGAAFKSVAGLQRHLNKRNCSKIGRSHERSICPHCPKVFSALCYLQRHIINVHGGTLNGNFVCKEMNCTATFSSKHALEIHRKRYHSLVRNIKCPFVDCTQIFDTFSRLGQHVMSNHSDESKREFNKSTPSLLSQVASKETIIFACPVNECAEVFSDQMSVKAHFYQHLMGEVPGDLISSLMVPEDSALPEVTWSAVDDVSDSTHDTVSTQLGSNLVQALDLMAGSDQSLISAIQEPDSDELLEQMLLTSALTLPDTAPPICYGRRHHYAGDNIEIGCARTDVRVNTSWGALLLRRRRLLLDRIAMPVSIPERHARTFKQLPPKYAPVLGLPAELLPDLSDLTKAPIDVFV